MQHIVMMELDCSMDGFLQIAHDIYPIAHLWGPYLWLSARLWYLQYINNGDTAVLH